MASPFLSSRQTKEVPAAFFPAALWLMQSKFWRWPVLQLGPGRNSEHRHIQFSTSQQINRENSPPNREGSQGSLTWGTLASCCNCHELSHTQWLKTIQIDYLTVFFSFFKDFIKGLYRAKSRLQFQVPRRLCYAVGTACGMVGGSGFPPFRSVMWGVAVSHLWVAHAHMIRQGVS